MIKIEIPSENKTLAALIGAALVSYGEGEKRTPASAEVVGHAHGGVEDAPDDGSLFSTPTPAPAEGVGAPDVDHYGVAFDEAFCAKAKDPFYSSGVHAGKWKCRKNVDKTAWEAWHNSQCAPAADVEPSGNDIAAAFGAQTGAAPEDVFPTDIGELALWSSKGETEGRWTAVQASAAMANAGGTSQLMAAAVGTDAAAANCRKVCEELLSVAAK